MTDTPSARTISRNVERLQRQLHAAVVRQLRTVVARRVKEEAIHASNLSDHTLADLAAMDHPYARRHPVDSGPHPDELIHRQTVASGLAFVDGFRTEVTKRDDGAELVLRNTSPHWPYLREGTDKMRPRPLHRWLAERIRREIVPEFRRAMKRAFRRFRPDRGGAWTK